jgi:hypothetical protein
MRKKAVMTADILNSLPGLKCNRVTGAMYAFPKICLPPKAIEEAKVGKYCRILEIPNLPMVLALSHIKALLYRITLVLFII